MTFLSPQTLCESVEFLRQSCDLIQDPLLVLLIQPSGTSLSKLIRMPQRLLLQERFTKHRQVFPVHAVQHHVHHLLHRAVWSGPGDVTVPQLRGTGRTSTTKSRRTPLLVPALLRPPQLFIFPRRSCQILFMLPLQLLKQVFVALLFLLSLLPATRFRSRERRRQPLSVCVLLVKILPSDAVGPVAIVFLFVVDRKKIVCCETTYRSELCNSTSQNAPL